MVKAFTGTKTDLLANATLRRFKVLVLRGNDEASYTLLLLSLQIEPVALLQSSLEIASPALHLPFILSLNC
jgi:hypothetical protein